jgi:hypothetical protein
LKVDSKGRVVFANGRELANGKCGVELGRWTSQGEVDVSFTRYSGQLDGTYCGDVIDLALTSTDDPVMLGRWNEGQGSSPPVPDGTIVTYIQPFSALDGTRQGNIFRVALDAVGEKTTRAYGIAVDPAGRFVFSGHQCTGGWKSASWACDSVIGRLTAAGALDPAFGTGGFTTFAFGVTDTTNQEYLYRVIVDHTTGDPISGGTNEGHTFGTMARLKGSDGTPAAFGSNGTLTRDLLTGAYYQVVSRTHFDSGGRIVFMGHANVNGDGGVQNYVVTGRMSGDGTYDATYGSAGVSTTPGSGLESAMGLDDRLYVVGNDSKVTVRRFWP